MTTVFWIINHIAEDICHKFLDWLEKRKIEKAPKMVQIWIREPKRQSFANRRVQKREGMYNSLNGYHPRFQLFNCLCRHEVRREQNWRSNNSADMTTGNIPLP
jgi:hypothetical protein